MLELAYGLGIGGVIGFLAGVLLATWVEPATTGGWALLVVVCVGIGATMGFLGRVIVKSTTKGKS
ncbi:MAG: hypothetical protein JJ920_12415 [Roseitalea sp.]|nr:hypothetical protein [Roseitalea sp.]MBO6720561.1 hypothetical protein [Roseitalea sp.]MBO6743708.1 hypothetical protein [Roseitalea sp.]